MALGMVHMRNPRSYATRSRSRPASELTRQGISSAPLAVYKGRLILEERDTGGWSRILG